MRVAYPLTLIFNSSPSWGEEGKENQKKKGAVFSRSHSPDKYPVLLHLVAFLEFLHSAGGIDNALFAGKIRMAFAAQLHPELFFCRACSKRITARTNDLGIVIIFWMDLFLHIANQLLR